MTNDTTGAAAPNNKTGSATSDGQNGNGNVDMDFEKDLENQYTTIDQVFPNPMRNEGFYGVAGDITEVMVEETEAPRESLLLHLISYLGNWLGRVPYTYVGGRRHFTTFFNLIVGPTGLGRKGTANGMVESFAEALSRQWYIDCCIGKSGYSTGEGLLWAIRDEREFYAKGGELITEAGVEDKRLMIVEEEFAKLLHAANRPNNTLTSYLRDLWQSPPVYATNTKTTPTVVTGPHVSMIGHITVKDLKTLASERDIGNGLFNRFIVGASKRKKVVVNPKPIEWSSKEHAHIFQKLARSRRVVDELPKGKTERLIHDSESWIDAWAEYYPTIGENRPANIEDLAQRQGDHINRIAALFAVLDGTASKTAKHLDAAIAVWDYCEASLHYAFETSVIGNPKSQQILWALLRAPGGMTKTNISDQVFHRNTPAVEINQCLLYLKESGLAYYEVKKTSKSKVEVWRAIRNS